MKKSIRFALYVWVLLASFVLPEFYQGIQAAFAGFCLGVMFSNHIRMDKP